MTLKRFPLIFLMLSALCLADDRAARDPLPDSSSQIGIRTKRNIGFDVGLGLPFPSIAGGMVGLNIYDALRVSVGIGSLYYWLTYQADVKVFLTRNAFAPYLGAGLSYLYGHSATIFGYHLHYEHILFPYISAGIDYTLEMGLHLMFNVSVATVPGTVLVWPGLAAGWYY